MSSGPYAGIPPLRGLEIIEGMWKNAEAETRVGHVLALGVTKATMWTTPTIYAYPAAATAMTVSSSSTDDDVGGTGALTARVRGLDANYAEVFQDVVLTGQVGVALPTDLIRVFGLQVLTAGATGGNVGTLYVGSGALVDGVPANKYAIVEPLLNTSLMTPFTIPDGKKGLITAVYASVGGIKDATMEFVVRKPGEVFRVRRIFHVRTAVLIMPLDLPITDIPARSDIEVRGLVDATTINASAAYDITMLEV
jgi:hypothetical protein